jgi:hypothetical protein
MGRHAVDYFLTKTAGQEFDSPDRLQKYLIKSRFPAAAVLLLWPHV